MKFSFFSLRMSLIHTFKIDNFFHCSPTQSTMYVLRLWRQSVTNILFDPRFSLSIERRISLHYVCTVRMEFEWTSMPLCVRTQEKWLTIHICTIQANMNFNFNSNLLILYDDLRMDAMTPVYDQIKMIFFSDFTWKIRATSKNAICKLLFSFIIRKFGFFVIYFSDPCLWKSVFVFTNLDYEVI